MLLGRWIIFIKKRGTVAFCTKLSLSLLPLWSNCGNRWSEWVKEIIKLWENISPVNYHRLIMWSKLRVSDSPEFTAHNEYNITHRTQRHLHICWYGNENLENTGFRVSNQQQKLSNAFSEHLFRKYIYFCTPPNLPISLSK